MRGRLVDVEVERRPSGPSRSSAASSSSPLGTDSTGLPAPTNIALICRCPGVVISLAISAAGSAPITARKPPIAGALAAVGPPQRRAHRLRSPPLPRDAQAC